MEKKQQLIEEIHDVMVKYDFRRCKERCCKLKYLSCRLKKLKWKCCCCWDCRCTEIKIVEELTKHITKVYYNEEKFFQLLMQIELKGDSPSHDMVCYEKEYRSFLQKSSGQRTFDFDSIFRKVMNLRISPDIIMEEENEDEEEKLE